MEAELCRAWAALWQLVQEQPRISHRQAAQQLGYSVGWVRKWRQRLAAGAATLEAALPSQSRRPRHSPRRISMEVAAQVVTLRHDLSQRYHRVVGPRTILAYLRQQSNWTAAWPHSTATIWRILKQWQCLPTERHAWPHSAWRRPAVGVAWEVDFCTVAQRSETAAHKQQHGLEALSVVDRGTSAAVWCTTASDYDAETSLLTIAHLLATCRVPASLIFDRDPRLVGSPSADLFPSAFIRYLWCVGCEPVMLAPHRPDLKPYVERFQRTLQTECTRFHRPTTPAAAAEVITPFCHWYNYQRPHQGDIHHLRPPLPANTAVLGIHPLPDQVDTAAWLIHYHQRYFKRQINASGSVQVWKQHYYLGRRLAGQACVLRLDAPTRSFTVEVNGAGIKQLPLKHLLDQAMPYDDYLAIMLDEARSEWRDYLWRHRALVQVS